MSHLSANPPLWARSIGMFSCFLVSGLMHELIFYYMNRTKPTWEGTAFFTLNGAATLVELAIRKNTQLRIPKFVSVPLTLTFLFVTAIWLFFPALCGPGTDTKSIAEFQHFFGQVYLTLWGS
jgi:membrane associated rhomboid family serine protease